MTPMTTSIPDKLGEWIQSQVAAGRYASAGDYVRQLITRDLNSVDDPDRWLADLDASIIRGIVETRPWELSDPFPDRR